MLAPARCSACAKKFLLCVLSEYLICLIWILFLGYKEPIQTKEVGTTKGGLIRERSEGQTESPAMRCGIGP